MKKNRRNNTILIGSLPVSLLLCLLLLLLLLCKYTTINAIHYPNGWRIFCSIFFPFSFFAFSICRTSLCFLMDLQAYSRSHNVDCRVSNDNWEENLNKHNNSNNNKKNHTYDCRSVWVWKMNVCLLVRLRANKLIYCTNVIVTKKMTVYFIPILDL